MTIDEMRVVARVVSHADGGCSTCVAALVSELAEAMPEFDWEMEVGRVVLAEKRARIVGVHSDEEMANIAPGVAMGIERG